METIQEFITWLIKRLETDEHLGEVVTVRYEETVGLERARLRVQVGQNIHHLSVD